MEEEGTEGVMEEERTGGVEMEEEGTEGVMVEGMVEEGMVEVKEEVMVEKVEMKVEVVFHVVPKLPIMEILYLFLHHLLL